MKSQPRHATESAGDPPSGEASSDAHPPGVLPPSATTTSGFHAAVPLRQHVEAHPTGKRLGILSLTALGIVYGDIGTSPLYALQQCFTSKEFSLAPTTENVYGVLSLIVALLVTGAISYGAYRYLAPTQGDNAGGDGKLLRVGQYAGPAAQSCLGGCPGRLLDRGGDLWDAASAGSVRVERAGIFAPVFCL